MPLQVGSRLKHAWNAFRNNRSPTEVDYTDGPAYTLRPDRPRFTRGIERSILVSVLNRIALDSAAIKINHVRLDDSDRFVSIINSGLNKCLNFSANKDQTGRAFLQDVYMSLMNEGCVAIVPIDTTINPEVSGSYDIESMRTAKILEWKADYVQIEAYDDRTGIKREIWVPKSTCCIVENPLYAIMNEPNSTMQRLKRKLAMLDAIDEQSSSGRLDLIVQLPFLVKGESKKKQAEERRQAIEDQLVNSKYGIGYIDATEHITQLNRPIENNLLKQIEYLTDMLFSQLGITKEIMDGTADEITMTNYYNRTIEPIVSAVVDELKRKFLTPTAITQKQSVMMFNDPFRLVPMNKMAEIGEVMTRNAVMSSNEIRQILGLTPSSDPDADVLRNKNLNPTAEEVAKNQEGMPLIDETT